MSAIRALRQIAVPLVARRSAITATAAVPRVGGMRVASLASSRTIASRGFASSTRRFGEGSSEQFVFFWSMPVRAALLNWGFFFLADVTLSQKLQEELNYEKETGGGLEEVPQFLKDFKSHGVWTVSCWSFLFGGLFMRGCLLLTYSSTIRGVC
jgi:complement component 1 Q subcomponent-binding protein